MPEKSAPEEMTSPIERGAHEHHKEQPAMPEFFGGEKGERKRWSADVVKRTLSGTFGKEVKTDEELQEVLEKIRSERLRKFIQALTLLGDSTVEGPGGREALTEDQRYLREEIVRQEELTGDDRLIAEKINNAINRKKNRLALTPPPTTAAQPIEVKIDLQPLVDEVKSNQQGLLQALSTHQITLSSFLTESLRQTQLVRESFQRVPASEEQDRWVDAEYKQDFYTRFTPSLEPRFYTEIKDEQERALWDARWQLARAAFYKKATAGFPEKYRENQDLALLTREQMERLYKMPGVRETLEFYVDALYNNSLFEELGGKTVWDCESGDDFEKFRAAIRDRVRREREQREMEKLTPLEAKSADAVAWNSLFCSNLVESLDSRYSQSGGRHGDLPGVMVAGEYRSLLHSQERFESKSAVEQEWGAFGKWGVTQMRRIKAQVGFDKDKDKLQFHPAPTINRYWFAARSGRVVVDSKGRAKNIVDVYIPECYPPTSVGSFLEETKTDIEKKALLEYLLARREIPWEDVGSDAWIIYLTTRFHKAFDLYEYFVPGKPFEMRKDGWAKEWARPIIDTFVRLNPNERLSRLRDVGKTYLTLRNFKNWAVYAATGGVARTDRSKPTLNLSLQERFVVSGTLKHKNVQYFRGGEGLGIT